MADSTLDKRFVLQDIRLVWDKIHYRYAINEVAKDIYATSIIFISPREGFKRLAKRHDWPSLTTYTLPVDNICPYLP
jgi:hypothetical protein